MTEVYYKWLLPDRRTPIQKVKWPKRVGAWTAEERPVLCESGWHGVERKDILIHLPRIDGSELWRVEVRGELVHGSDKFSAPSMRLVERLVVPTREQYINFALDVAEDVLPIFEKYNPKDKRVRQCLETTREFMAGKATLKEVENAATTAAAYAATANAAVYAYVAYNTATAAAWAAAYAVAYATNAYAYAAAYAKYNDMFCKQIGV
jgi:hypothetical protein